MAAICASDSPKARAALECCEKTNWLAWTYPVRRMPSSRTLASSWLTLLSVNIPNMPNCWVACSKT